MTTLQDVLPVDPADDAAFAAWFAVVRASQQAASPEPGDTAAEVRAHVLAGERPGASSRVLLLAATDRGGAVVGAASLELPLRDNQHLAMTEHVHVHPGARRRGAGSRLLEALERLAAGAGRRTLVLGLEETAQEVSAGSSPGRAFLVARGFTEANTEVRRDLDLPADPARLDALEAVCRRHATGYALRTWQDTCPDDLVEDRALLGRRMSTDTPVGSLPLEEEEWDAARVRERERTSREAGRRVLGAGAVHLASGRMVAFTELGLPPEDPARAFQWETLVLREHRGHRLGTLVKLANLRQAAQRWPGTRYVSTWNAATNAPMIAVNEALGCRVRGAWSDWTRPVGQGERAGGDQGHPGDRAR